jgi:hypothetical protein
MVSATRVAADTRVVDGPNLDALREELGALEARERELSAERRRLHNQIDSGFGSDSTRAREREVSDERRELHRRIDSLREILRVEPGDDEPSAEKGTAVRELEPDQGLERLPYPAAG